MKRFDIEDKVAVVIGGSGLLGSEFVKTLFEAKAHVIIVDLKEPDCNYYMYHFVYADITNEKSIAIAVEKIIKRFKKIDIVINCAGLNPQINNEYIRFEDYSLSDWNKSISVNLIGAFLCCREFGREMIEQESGGVMVTIGSQLGIVAPDQNIYDGKYIKPIDYSVSKAGIIGLTKYLASYWKDKIRINCLIPSMIYNNQDKDFVKRVENKIPLGRMAEKYEFNAAILFLCSDASSYMTGQCFVIDGGYTII